MLRLKNLDKEVYDNYVKSHKDKSHSLHSESLTEFIKVENNLTPYYLGLVSENDEINSVVIDYGEYTITINKENVKEDLLNTIDDLSLVVSDETKTDDLVKYVAEENTFIKTTTSGVLPANVVTLSLNLIKYANKEVNLYYFNPDNKE